MTKAKSVDDYLNALPEDARDGLQLLRHSIRSAAPMAEEMISYGIPTYKYHGPLVHFAAFKGHCSLITVDSHVIDLFADELSEYVVAGTTIRFEHGKPPHAGLVKKIVNTRLKQNEDRA